MCILDRGLVVVVLRQTYHFTQNGKISAGFSRMGRELEKGGVPSLPKMGRG